MIAQRFLKEKKIIVDMREPLAELLPCVKEKLEIGDIICGDYIIERKSEDDFINSIIDGRIFDQLKKLSETGKQAILIVEGSPYAAARISEKAISTLLAEALNAGISIVFLPNLQATAAFTKVLCSGKSVSEKIQIKKSNRDPILLLIASIPGVGVKKAEALLKHFGSIRKLAQANPRDLMKVPGIGQKIALSVYRILNATWKKEEHARDK